MKHVNPSFSIQAPKISFTTSQLFVEAGSMGFSMVVLDNENTFRAVVIYTFPGGLNEQDLKEKLEEVFHSENLLQKQYHKTHIFWAFPESILVPAELMDEEQNTNMLNLVFGDAKQGNIKSDFLYKHNLYNIYRIPGSYIDLFSAHLPVSTQTHVFSAIVNRDIPEGNHLFTVFYNCCLTIMLIREGKLQVIKNFEYSSPDDCVFHLLNVCKGFDVDPGSVILHINGMIDKNSELYASIYKYFLHIEFDKLQQEFTYHETIKDHPPHFFSHLFYLASCV